MGKKEVGEFLISVLVLYLGICMPLKTFREHGIGWAVLNYLRIAPVCGAVV